MQYQRVLITGGAGFVGANLALRLREAIPEAQVVCFDNLKRRGSEFNLPRLKQAGIDFVHGDVRVAGDLPDAKFDLLLDCAAEPSVLAGYGSGAPDYLLNTNLTGTLHLLELARRHSADLLFLSTSRVYPVETLNALRWEEAPTRFELTDPQDVTGASSRGVAEEFPLHGARSLYGATKLCSEIFIEEYAAAYGVRAIINRCGVLTGPWQMGKVDQGVFALWAARHHFGLPLGYIGWGGTGKQVRDFLHVDDLWSLLRLQLSDFNRYQGGCFNVGGGREVSLSLQETTALCQELTGREVPVKASAEDRPGDLRIYLTDSSRIQALSGWKPAHGPRETLESIVRWIRDHEALVRTVFVD